MRFIKRAILSVHNKTGIVDFARGLRAFGVELLSTGGTYKQLSEAGIPVTEVSAYTGFAEMLDGRVKTLHPLIHGAILGKRDNASHLEQMNRAGITPIDLVAVNLYPFEETVARPGVTWEDAIEQIDIGGPSLLRSAAKNHQDVLAVTCPDRYENILNEMKASGGAVSLQTRRNGAKEVFAHTSAYDRAIFDYFNRQEVSEFPEQLSISLTKVKGLRYGENPHQSAALYRGTQEGAGTLAEAVQRSGKEMSYNNFLDADAALTLVRAFREIAVVIVKHNNPCGVATCSQVASAYRKARATDPTSAFGGVAAFNRTIDIEAANEIASTFMEVVVGPDITDEAASFLATKKNLRVLITGETAQTANHPFEMRRISGGWLLQTQDTRMIDEVKTLKVASARPPSDEEARALLFAWKVSKQVKSNAIVFAKNGQTVGIGAGQMNRVDSVQIAIMKAQMPTVGCVMASDAFFPFRDGIDAAAKAGITAVIQPGGSIRDAEVIQAANERNMAMVLTGIRHFRH